MPSKKPTAEIEGQDKAATKTAGAKSVVAKGAKVSAATPVNKPIKTKASAAPAVKAATEPATKPATKKGGKPAPAAAPKKKAAVETKKLVVAKAKGKSADDEPDVDDDDDDADTDEAAAGEGGSARAQAARAKRRAEGSLIIVESPAKAKTIKKYLGAGYTVKASVGHVKDLPKKNMGIDIEHDFAPRYEVIDGKKKVLAEIKKAAGEVAKIYLAPDPDREGEAIAWHIAEEIRGDNPNIYRVLFNEITKKAITEAMTRPTSLDMKKFESQQARRILDRLVGYQISPVLWTKVKRGLSAGRVQSVAVRLIVEREGEVAAFKPQEYWSVEVTVEGDSPPPFIAKVARVDGKKAELTNEGQAREVVDAVAGAALKVLTVERKERKKNPPPPFITSKLQQEGSSKLRFSPKRTMSLAQRLYEGVEMGEDGLIGLITYMRTDSTRLSDDAVTEVRAYIGEKFGPASLPGAPVVYKTKKSAQDAHEAIRPTTLKYDPEQVRKLWAIKGGGRDERETDDLLRLYTLIWNRFVACQMVPAVFDQTSIDIEAGRVELRATGQVMKVPGFLEVYAETVEDGATDEDAPSSLPEVKDGEALRLIETRPEQHFTQPPPRFSEASLVKELEEKGIGRPSTYAAILSTVQDRGYVEKREGRLHPTEMGTMVNGLLVKSFPEIVNTDFTARMEEQLDEVEEGHADWVKLLHSFYGPFKEELEKAKIEMRDVKREEQPTDQVCEKCTKPMVIKWGRNGYFLACSGYPDCRNTKEYTRNADGSLKVMPTTRPSDQICPTCSSPMVIRRGRFGEFLACSRYPECKTTSPISLGVACPKEGCGGYLTEKRSRKGKTFFGCANYSKTGCDFVSWDRPVPTACPNCAAPFIVQKVTKAGMRLRCIKPDCGYAADGEAPEDGGGSNEGSGSGGAAGSGPGVAATGS